MFNTMALMDKLKVTTDKSEIRKIDKIYCISLSFSDVLISLYLSIILVQDTLFKGDYCKQDMTWRSSHFCNFLGFVFQLCLLEILQASVSMATTRVFVIASDLGTQINFRLVQTVSVGLHVMNFILAITLLAPIYLPTSKFDGFCSKKIP